ncbi:MAG: KamA family radical SAM protein [Proteobacteria bacterium]|nr:KamA family radical SAM protein [Pseudomonadota bacterium]
MSLYHGCDRTVGRQRVLQLRPDLEDCWERVDSLFPIRIARPFWARATHGDDPLARQVLPDPRELEIDDSDLADPVGEEKNSPVPWVIRKHRDRLLLMITRRCHQHCRFCFRRRPAGSHSMDPTREEWERALGYVEQSGVTEVILSGGDPLAVSDQRLFETLERLKQFTLRLHTRAPIAVPERISPALVDGLRRSPVWVVVHVNHPREVDEAVSVALTRLVDAGIPLLQQTVLLRGVNDSVEVLAELCQKMVRLRVFPYYLHHADCARGMAHFRLSIREGRLLYEALRGRISGVALPRYVIDLPDGTGKTDVNAV